jgi:hypothetical protein
MDMLWVCLIEMSAIVQCERSLSFTYFPDRAMAHFAGHEVHAYGFGIFHDPSRINVYSDVLFRDGHE